MNKFIWRDEYSVGIKIIDEQHKRFFEIADEIYNLLQNKPISKDTVTLAVNNLGSYALYHLFTEEKYFKDFEYAGQEDHIKKHDFFREKVAGYIEKLKGLEGDYEAIADEMGNFSESWLVFHILETDKKYIDCFKAHGLN